MTAVAPRPRALDFMALAVVGLHRTKIAILEHIGAGGNVACSPKEIAEAIGVSLPATSYHVRQLVEKGLLVLVRTEPRRGALAHFYVAAEDALLSGRQKAHARLLEGANGSTADVGQRLHEVLEHAAAANGGVVQTWAESGEDHKKIMRVAGREVFGRA